MEVDVHDPGQAPSAAAAPARGRRASASSGARAAPRRRAAASARAPGGAPTGRRARGTAAGSRAACSRRTRAPRTRPRPRRPCTSRLRRRASARGRARGAARPPCARAPRFRRPSAARGRAPSSACGGRAGRAPRPRGRARARAASSSPAAASGGRISAATAKPPGRRSCSAAKRAQTASSSGRSTWQETTAYRSAEVPPLMRGEVSSARPMRRSTAILVVAASRRPSAARGARARAGDDPRGVRRQERPLRDDARRARHVRLPPGRSVCLHAAPLRLVPRSALLALRPLVARGRARADRRRRRHGARRPRDRDASALDGNGRRRGAPDDAPPVRRLARRPRRTGRSSTASCSRCVVLCALLAFEDRASRDGRRDRHRRGRGNPGERAARAPADPAGGVRRVASAAGTTRARRRRRPRCRRRRRRRAVDRSQQGARSAACALTTDSRALWKANNPNTYDVLDRGGWIDDVPELPGAPPWPELAADLTLAGQPTSVDECAQMRLYREEVLEFWREHPGEKARLALQATRMLWSPVPSESDESGSGLARTARRTVEPAYVLALYGLAIVGLFVAPAPLRRARARSCSPTTRSRRWSSPARRGTGFRGTSCSRCSPRSRSRRSGSAFGGDVATPRAPTPSAPRVELLDPLRAALRRELGERPLAAGDTHRRGARSRSPARATIASASASASPEGTTRPVSPSATISGRPPTALAITGRARSIASSATMPNPSPSEGTTTIAASSIASLHGRDEAEEAHGLLEPELARVRLERRLERAAPGDVERRLRARARAPARARAGGRGGP